MGGKFQAKRVLLSDILDNKIHRRVPMIVTQPRLISDVRTIIFPYYRAISQIVTSLNLPRIGTQPVLECVYDIFSDEPIVCMPPRSGLGAGPEEISTEYCLLAPKGRSGRAQFMNFFGNRETLCRIHGQISRYCEERQSWWDQVASEWRRALK